MNKLYPILFFVLYACAEPGTRNNASISFRENKHDFGTISYKKEAVFTFEFSNPGKTMLIINNVKTSCGCTVPEWAKEPVHPGQKGKIKIKYDAVFPGTFYKTVEVFYNGVNSPANLEIKGEVEYPKEL